MATDRHRAALPDLALVLRDLYGALATEGGFMRCLDVLAVPLRSHFAAIHHEDPVTKSSWVEVAGAAAPADLAALEEEYSSRWVGQNEWLQKGLERILTSGYGDGDDTVTEAELYAMPYYQHYLRRLDVRHGIGICLWQGGPGQVAIASFNRPPVEGRFDLDVERFMQALRPHLYNAYAIHRRTNMLSDENRSWRASMDQAPIGILVLDEGGHVLQSNREGEARLSSRQGMSRTTGGRLVIDHYLQQQRLHAAVADLCAGVNLNSTILVVRPGRPAAEGVVVHLCAVPKTDGGGPMRVIAFLCPLTADCRERIASMLLQSALALTPAEARVVLALQVSHDLAQVAADLGVGVTTVRSHLNHAFRKTGASKQAELAALVERLLATVPASSPYMPDSVV